MLLVEGAREGTLVDLLSVVGCELLGCELLGSLGSFFLLPLPDGCLCGEGCV